MKSTPEIWSVYDIIVKSINGTLNPDPIAQRPPVSQGYSKPIAIMRSLLEGYGIGLFTLRDIRNDPEMKKLYPKVDYTVIDAGHRTRSIRDFYNGKFHVDGKFSSDFDMEFFKGIMIQVNIVECSTEQAIQIFRNINTTTPVNFMEMVMCDEVSDVCKEIRMRTKTYQEYDYNDIHPIFETRIDKMGNVKACHWDTHPNPRRKWDEYVSIAMLKAIGGGNVSAGEKQIERFASEGKISKNALGVVDRFFDDALKFRLERKREFSSDTFGAFQLVWFGFYEKNKQFKISNMRKFVCSFVQAYTFLTSSNDSKLKDTTIEFDGEKHFLKEFVRKNIKKFANSPTQKECFNAFAQFGTEEDFGIIFREEKRSYSQKEREEKLALQGYVCAIDGQYLSLEEAVWGHDTPWAKGGKLEDGEVIRKSHNRDMGSVTLDQYRKLLNSPSIILE